MHNVSVMLEMNEVNMAVFKAILARYKKMNLGVTPVHGRIIMFIYDNKLDICQKDIEKYVACNKSTVSAILNTMEKNDLIVRNGVAGDQRRNIISLTDKSLKMANKLKDDEKQLDDIFKDGITEQELKLFSEVLCKIKNNIERI